MSRKGPSAFVQIIDERSKQPYSTDEAGSWRPPIIKRRIMTRKRKQSEVSNVQPPNADGTMPPERDPIEDALANPMFCFGLLGKG